MSRPTPSCPGCGTVLDILVEKDETIDTLTEELVSARRTITRLRGDRDDRRKRSAMAKPAEEVFRYWRDRLMPNAREFNGKRLAAVVDRLEGGASVEDLKKAIDGCALRPYASERGRTATGSKDERRVELELICRDEGNVQRFQSYADAVAPPTPSPTPAPVPEAKVNGVEPPFRKLMPRWQAALGVEVAVRLQELRGWTIQAIRSLGLGLDGSRVVFPAHDAEGELVGVVRYQPNPEDRNEEFKSVAEGSRELFPRPEVYDGGVVWLVEGEADSVAARSLGLPAVGVPGVATWKAGWAHRFERFDRVVVCFDTDLQGREAADARVRALGGAKVNAVRLELDPGRTDGYDLGDLLREHREGALWRLEGALGRTRRSSPSSQRVPTPATAPAWVGKGDPVERVLDALRQSDRKVTGGNGQWSSFCPAHEDRNSASLSVGAGQDGRVLIHCHAGCTGEEVLAALDLTWHDAFAERLF